MWHRCQKRTVSLDQQSVQRHHLRDFLPPSGAREGDNAGKRHVESEIEYALRHRAVASKAMEHTTDLVRVLLAKNSKGILFRFSRMDDDWQLALFREPDLLAKDLLLHGPRRKVVVIIEPDLSKATRQRLGVDDASGCCRGISGITGEFACGVRMNTDRKPDSRPLRSQIAGPRDLGLVIRRENHERMRDARGLRATDDVG